MQQVNVLEAKNRLSELLRSVAKGEEVVIANRGVPVARLVGFDQPPAGPTGSTITEWLERHPLPEHARRSRDEIDSDIRAERGSWG